MFFFLFSQRSCGSFWVYLSISFTKTFYTPLSFFRLGDEMGLAEVNDSINEFFAFVAEKLHDFPSLTRGEQVGFGCVFLGLLLIILGLVLFVI